MDRREFLQNAAAVIAAAGLSTLNLDALEQPAEAVPGDTVGQTSADFAAGQVSGNSAAGQASAGFDAGGPSTSGATGTLEVLFLGTGAAGGKSEESLMRRRQRGSRQSSVLLDGRILVDLTADALDLLPDGFVPECIFYTHSHSDHYAPKVAVEIGVPLVFVSETWAERAAADFRAVAGPDASCAGGATDCGNGRAVPEIVPLRTGQRVQRGDIFITALPADHCPSDLHEQALIYLIEKGGTRLLYATDTSGIMGVAARMAGIDAHLKEDQRVPITGLIMEATMARDDFRIFNHSSLEDVVRTVRILSETGCYRPEAGGCDSSEAAGGSDSSETADGCISSGAAVYVTHRSRSLHGGLSDDELEASWPAPLKPARDGLVVRF